MNCPLHVIDAGTEVPYLPMLERQRALAQRLIDTRLQGRDPQEEYMLLLEHSHVYTLGRRGHEDNMLLSPEALSDQGIEYVHTDRGGDITYHGPGQLVAYPIIDLEAHHLGVKGYVDLLEQSVIQLLDLYGIQGRRVQGATGVWLDPGTPAERKICAIGVHCSHWITTHGIGLNVNTDLSRFAAIHPCGFIDKGVTSMARELGHALDLTLVKAQYASILTTLLQQ